MPRRPGLQGLLLVVRRSARMSAFPGTTGSNGLSWSQASQFGLRRRVLVWPGYRAELLMPTRKTPLLVVCQ